MSDLPASCSPANMTLQQPAMDAGQPVTPAAQQRCEHYWVDHCYGGLSVRLCQFCHEPDWEDLRGQLGEAERKGQLAERERCARVADQLGVRYLYIEPAVRGSSYMPGCSIKPFGDRLRQDDGNAA